MPANTAHRKAEELRECDEHLPALQAIEEALVEYQKAGDYYGFSQALQSRVLIYKHLFLLAGDSAYLTLATHDAQASLEIATQHNVNDILSSCNFRLGEVSLLSENYSRAREYFQASLDLFAGAPAEKGDYLYHLGEAVFLEGDRLKGKSLMLSGLDSIRSNSSSVGPFLAHVWESGCLIKLASLTYKEDFSSAKQYLLQAQAIIGSDPKLVIRKRQLETELNKLKEFENGER